MLNLRKASDRGLTQTDWLTSHHTFSFGDYDDPKHRGFSHLRVINEDVVEADTGFAMHSHHDMEIITYVVEGEIAHKDSIGNGSIIKPGEIQKMSAGHGIRHSEFNPSKTNSLHLLQIWIIPNKSGITPAYEQKNISHQLNQLILIGSPNGSEHAVKIHQNVRLYVAYIESGITLNHPLTQKNAVWVQIVKGKLKLNGSLLSAGDGAAIVHESNMTIETMSAAEILVFDMKAS